MDQKALAREWNRRASQDGLYAVMSRRWTPMQCEEVNTQHTQVLLNWLGPLEGKHILDAGCGIGRLSAIITQQNATVIGVDTSEVMLSKARAVLSPPQALFLQASLDALPLESASVDGALAVMVLQHLLEEPLFIRALDELVRVVKPGGRILIIDGIGKTRHQPENSPVTLVRTFSDYDTLKVSCRLLNFSKLVCAGDDYTVLVWERMTQV